MNNLADPKGIAFAKQFLAALRKSQDELNKKKWFKVTDICPCGYEEAKLCKKACTFGA